SPCRPRSPRRARPPRPPPRSPRRRLPRRPRSPKSPSPRRRESRRLMGRSPGPRRGRGSGHGARVRDRKGASAGSPKGAFTRSQAARVVGGRVHGDGATLLTGVATLESAGRRDLSWVNDERLEAAGASSRAGALLVSSESRASGKPAVVVPLPQLALARWLEARHARPRPRPGKARGAFVD